MSAITFLISVIIGLIIFFVFIEPVIDAPFEKIRNDLCLESGFDKAEYRSCVKKVSSNEIIKREFYCNGVTPFQTYFGEIYECFFIKKELKTWVKN